LHNGRANIDMTRCKGCGRCIAVCPTSAISLHMDERVDPLGRIMARVDGRTSIGRPGT